MTDDQMTQLRELARGRYEEDSPDDYGGTGAWVYTDEQLIARALVELLEWKERARYLR